MVCAVFPPAPKSPGQKGADLRLTIQNIYINMIPRHKHIYLKNLNITMGV